jgi:hypothetical protein
MFSQFLYAGAQGRLGHVASLRRVPEMTVICQQDQMLELAKTWQVHHWLQKRLLGPVSVRIR